MQDINDFKEFHNSINNNLNLDIYREDSFTLISGDNYGNQVLGYVDYLCNEVIIIKEDFVYNINLQSTDFDLIFDISESTYTISVKKDGFEFADVKKQFDIVIDIETCLLNAYNTIKEYFSNMNNVINVMSDIFIEKYNKDTSKDNKEFLLKYGKEEQLGFTSEKSFSYYYFYFMEDDMTKDVLSLHNKEDFIESILFSVDLLVMFSTEEEIKNKLRN